mmetsp:Transcript_9393/g.39450  ORF Transcript_9393/g.39450 Transcript_9393/m.39450 type:complete len:208 (+) Transcript_9393:1645-2268(+)
MSRVSTSSSRPSSSTVCVSPKPCASRASHVRCTCSMHGLNAHSTPSWRSERAAEGTTFHGPGKSKNTASHRFSRHLGKPSFSTSRCETVHALAKPCVKISSFAASARARLNSKVYTCPLGATARTSACVRDALPVPDSSTTLPGLSSSACATSEMSGAYRICVRCGRTLVQSSGVGASSQTNPLPSPLPYTLAPKGLPTQSRWGKLP